MTARQLRRRRAEISRLGRQGTLLGWISKAGSAGRRDKSKGIDYYWRALALEARARRKVRRRLARAGRRAARRAR